MDDKDWLKKSLGEEETTENVDVSPASLLQKPESLHRFERSNHPQGQV